MKKPKDGPREDEPQVAAATDTPKTKREAWAALEVQRLEAVKALEVLDDQTARAASGAAEEARANGANGVRGPGGYTYQVQTSRKAKGSDEPPKYPYTLRKVPEIRV